MSASAPDSVAIDMAAKFTDGLFTPYRYKVWYGGRGAGKSIALARGAIARAHTGKELILCAREFQNSIADSVHRVIRSQIFKLGLGPWFDITDHSITSRVTGSEFIFKGMHHNIDGIRSTEGVTICWLEEGQRTSADSWQILDPTIREAGSEIWISMNPDLESDPLYATLISERMPNSYVVKVGWQDNPWFPDVLETQRRHMKLTDPDAYDWVWEGNCRRNTAATIFRNKVVVETFDEAPYGTQFYHGVDWGFADDPTVMIRCWIQPSSDGNGDDLMIDREAYGHGIEIDELPALFDSIETSRNWPIKADAARPETISYLARRGFDIAPAKKWQGSVEDGIAHLKGFRRIVIHERCPYIAQESRLYSYKVDRLTGDVLPIIVDKNNHGFDATRYSLDGYIHKRGGLGVWERLAS